MVARGRGSLSLRYYLDINIKKRDSAAKERATKVLYPSRSFTVCYYFARLNTRYTSKILCSTEHVLAGDSVVSDVPFIIALFARTPTPSMAHVDTLALSLNFARSALFVVNASPVSFSI